MDIWQVLRLLTPATVLRKTTALSRRTVSRPTSNTTCSTRSSVCTMLRVRFHQDSFFYNAKQDYYVCPIGQHTWNAGLAPSTTTANGYQTESARYRAQSCEGCPLRGTCFRAKGNRVIEVNHRLKEYKRKASERLTSEDGIKHRGRRCIEPEAVFGQMKADYRLRTIQTFWKRQGRNGLCLLCHCLQSEENV